MGLGVGLPSRHRIIATESATDKKTVQPSTVYEDLAELNK